MGIYENMNRLTGGRVRLEYKREMKLASYSSMGREDVYRLIVVRMET